jgi:hypothetical protein
MIELDMISYGYDPKNPLDVEAYWEQRLSWLKFIQKTIVFIAIAQETC